MDKSAFKQIYRNDEFNATLYFSSNINLGKRDFYTKIEWEIPWNFFEIIEFLSDFEIQGNIEEVDQFILLAKNCLKNILFKKQKNLFAGDDICYLYVKNFLTSHDIFTHFGIKNTYAEISFSYDFIFDDLNNEIVKEIKEMLFKNREFFKKMVLFEKINDNLFKIQFFYHVCYKTQQVAIEISKYIFTCMFKKLFSYIKK